MKSFLKRLFIDNWPRKLVAIIAALVIWLLVNHSITVTRTIPNVPIRVLNIPTDKTIEGVGPGGLLPRRIPLTLTGRKQALDRLTSKDIEVVTDAEGAGDRWTIEVTKRNIVGKNAEIDVAHDISSVAPIELTVQLSNLITEKVPITVTEPVGEPPTGFLFIGVWPQRLVQTVSGPEESVKELKAKGLRLTFNLSDITPQELQTLSQEQVGDEISFPVPASWKSVTIPFLQDKKEAINDPEAEVLHLTFLKSELLPLSEGMPVATFFPLTYSLTLNPEAYPLVEGGAIGKKNGIATLSFPVYARNVSRLFLTTVQNQLQVTFRAIPKSLSSTLPWSMEFIDPVRLEEEYLAAFLRTIPEEQRAATDPTIREADLRMRFRRYLRKFELVDEHERPVALVGVLTKEGISVTLGNEKGRNTKK
ncbi:MAG: YbbR-like domain-containing protein [Parachlamydiales bacterium]